MRAALLAVALAAALSSPAGAQLYPSVMRVPCAAGDFLPELLRREYGEAAVAEGVANGALVQLWRNEKAHTWTLILIRPSGGACALATGDEWSPAGRPGEGK